MLETPALVIKTDARNDTNFPEMLAQSIAILHSWSQIANVKVGIFSQSKLEESLTNRISERVDSIGICVEGFVKAVLICIAIGVEMMLRTMKVN